MHEKNMMNEDADKYGVLFDLFRRSSNEEEKIMQIIISEIKKKESCKSLLDIGAGDGTITQKIIKYFDEVYAVEKRNDCRLFLKALGIKMLCKDWTKFVETQKFDVILASHVFYYFPIPEWKTHISKMLKLLNDDGMLILITNSTNIEYSTFIKKTYPKIIGHEFTFASVVDNLDLVPETYEISINRISTEISLENKEHFLSMCEFWLGSSRKNWGETMKEISETYNNLEDYAPKGKLLKQNVDILIIKKKD